MGGQGKDGRTVQGGIRPLLVVEVGDHVIRPCLLAELLRLQLGQLDFGLRDLVLQRWWMQGQWRLPHQVMEGLI